MKVWYFVHPKKIKMKIYHTMQNTNIVTTVFTGQLSGIKILLTKEMASYLMMVLLLATRCPQILNLPTASCWIKQALENLKLQVYWADKRLESSGPTLATTAQIGHPSDDDADPGGERDVQEEGEARGEGKGKKKEEPAAAAAANPVCICSDHNIAGSWHQFG